MLSGILLSLQKGLLLSDNRDKPEDIVLNATSQSHEDKHCDSASMRSLEEPGSQRQTGGRWVPGGGRGDTRATQWAQSGSLGGRKEFCGW